MDNSFTAFAITLSHAEGSQSTQRLHREARKVRRGMESLQKEHRRFMQGCKEWFSLATINSPIHKAAGSLVTSCSLQNGKMSMGNHHTERPPDPVLYGGRPSGGFVNRTVTALFTKPLAP